MPSRCQSFQDHGLEPEAVVAAGKAYDSVIASIKNDLSCFEAVALAILAAASDGERNVDHLIEIGRRVPARSKTQT
jgi:hypothetical protein